MPDQQEPKDLTPRQLLWAAIRDSMHKDIPLDIQFEAELRKSATADDVETLRSLGADDIEIGVLMAYMFLERHAQSKVHKLQMMASTMVLIRMLP